MSTFRLKITTLDKVFFDDQVEQIVIRTTAGDVGILHDHIDYVATLRIGKLSIINGKTTKEAAISGGVIEMAGGVANVLTLSAEWADEINIKRAEEAKLRAEKNLEGKLSKNEARVQEAALRRAINRIKIT